MFVLGILYVSTDTSLMYIIVCVQQRMYPRRCIYIYRYTFFYAGCIRRVCPVGPVSNLVCQWKCDEEHDKSAVR